MTTSSSHPIVRKEELPPWWMFWKRPALIRNMAMVLVRNGQPEKALLDTDQSQWSQLTWSRYESIYWVDMSGRSFLLEATLPTRQPGLDFQATVYIPYKVDDPLVILNSRVIHPQAAIEEQATAIMREASRKHLIVEIGAAEKSIQQALSTDIQIAGIAITRCFVTLDAGEEERDHARKVRALERK